MPAIFWKSICLRSHDDVEGVADLEVQRLVLRRVVDAILADELHAALRVGLVDAHDARRHRHAEPGSLFVLELVEHLHDVLDRRAGVLRVVVVERLPFDDVALLDREAGAAEHAHLLGLAVVDRRLSAQRVEVVVGERLLRHRRRRRRVATLCAHVIAMRPKHLAHAIEIAGHELQLRVAERRCRCRWSA